MRARQLGGFDKGYAGELTVRGQKEMVFLLTSQAHLIVTVHRPPREQLDEVTVAATQTAKSLPFESCVVV